MRIFFKICVILHKINQKIKIHTPLYTRVYTLITTAFHHQYAYYYIKCHIKTPKSPLKLCRKLLSQPVSTVLLHKAFTVLRFILMWHKKGHKGLWLTLHFVPLPSLRFRSWYSVMWGRHSRHNLATSWQPWLRFAPSRPYALASTVQTRSMI